MKELYRAQRERHRHLDDHIECVYLNAYYDPRWYEAMQQLKRRARRADATRTQSESKAARTRFAHALREHAEALLSDVDVTTAVPSPRGIGSLSGTWGVVAATKLT